MMKKLSVYLGCLLFIQLYLPINAFAASADKKTNSPKNVIIMIGDGMGFNYIKAADYYQYGEEGKQVYENFPVKIAASTYPAKLGSYGEVQPWSHGYNPAEAWTDFGAMKTGYTESAAAATALATGKKTYNNAIGMDLDQTTKLQNLTEFAKQLGKSTGVVTTVTFSDATPAGFVAHNVSRQYYEEIAQEMILDSKCSVIMGTGDPMYDDNSQIVNKDAAWVGGKELWTQLLGEAKTTFTINGKEKTVQDIDGDGKPDSWTLIQDKADFQKLMSGDAPKRVIGVPKAYGTVQQGRGGDAFAVPFYVPFVQSTPALFEMSLGALNVLGKNPAGFLVMIEGGAIDRAGHKNQKGRIIEEVIDFNKAIEAVVKWVETNSSWDETLLIITADHETGLLQWPQKGKFNEIVNNGKGEMPGMEFNSDNHSNSLVPVYAKGAGSEILDMFADQADSVRGRFLNNTVIPNVIRTILK